MPSDVSTLRAAESQALSKKEQTFGGSEGSGGGFYTGTGRSNNAKVKGKGKKGWITLALIASLMVGGGAFLGSSNSLLAPAMEALFTEQSDTQYTSGSIRYVKMLTGMLNGKGYDMPDKFSTNLAKNGITVNSDSLTWKGQTIPANQVESFYKTNVDFREDFNTSKYGRAIGFYDNSANKTYKKYNVSRNLFSNFKQTSDADANAEVFNKTMTDKFDGNTTTVLDSKSEVEHERNIYDEDTGELIGTEKYPETEYGGTDKTTSSGADIDAAEQKADSYLSGISAKVTKVLDGACGIYRVGNLISMTIAANEKLQSIALFMGIMESISKMKAGYGDSSAINETLNKLSTSVTAKFKDAYGEQHELTGSPLESTGMQAVLGGATKAIGATTLASLSKNFSLTRVSTAIFGKGWTSTACSAEQIGSSIFSLAVNLGGGVAGIVGGFAINFIMGVLIGSAINLALKFLVPTIANLFLNYYSVKTGIPFGNLFTAGAFEQGAVIAANSGANPASQENTVAYMKTTNQVLALDAEIDRKNLSPFDATNKNTFFGSIAYSLLPAITSTKMTSLSSFIRSATSSLSTLMGGVSADGENSSYITTFGDCPDAKENDFASGIFCETFRTNDLTTVDVQPSDTNYKNIIEPNLNSDGSIKKDSELAKFITYCNGRTSPFGITDAGILSSLRGDSGVLGYIPIVGDVVNIIDGFKDMENLPWADGTKCINNSSNDFWQQEGKWYQMYVQDHRILEQMGSTEKNPVTAYEEEYEKEHPTDNSTAGIIARYTGMAKSDAEIMLAVLEYTDFIDSYDPTTRIAMSGNTSDLPSGEEYVASLNPYKDNPDFTPTTYAESPLDTKVAMREHIVYADVRNRSYAA